MPTAVLILVGLTGVRKGRVDLEADTGVVGSWRPLEPGVLGVCEPVLVWT